MKTPAGTAKPKKASRQLLDPQRFPLHSQTEATAGRDKVREVAYPVRAARQSQRRVERTSKGRTGA